MYTIVVRKQVKLNDKVLPESVAYYNYGTVHRHPQALEMVKFAIKDHSLDATFHITTTDKEGQDITYAQKILVDGRLIEYEIIILKEWEALQV